jgi:heme/copper-type cytochrome/quinol oxidase subunit 2
MRWLKNRWWVIVVVLLIAINFPTRTIYYAFFTPQAEEESANTLEVDEILEEVIRCFLPIPQ